jgi:hypothetical protein
MQGGAWNPALQTVLRTERLHAMVLRRLRLLIGLLPLTLVACDPFPVQPECDAPRPVRGRFDERVPDLIVLLNERVAVREALPVLERRHGFRTDLEWESINGFSITRVAPRVVAGLQCEPMVSLLEWNAVGSFTRTAATRTRADAPSR